MSEDEKTIMAKVLNVRDWTHKNDKYKKSCMHLCSFFPLYFTSRRSQEEPLSPIRSSHFYIPFQL